MLRLSGYAWRSHVRMKVANMSALRSSLERSKAYYLPTFYPTKMNYVYILKSKRNTTCTYIGYTSDLLQRL